LVIWSKLATSSTAIVVAKVLGLTVKQAAPIRDELIKKGITYSPKRGLVAFTVPKFDEYMKRKIHKTCVKNIFYRNSVV
jgi:hypothetical protein